MLQMVQGGKMLWSWRRTDAYQCLHGQIICALKLGTMFDRRLTERVAFPNKRGFCILCKGHASFATRMIFVTKCTPPQIFQRMTGWQKIRLFSIVTTSESGLPNACLSGGRVERLLSDSPKS